MVSLAYAYRGGLPKKKELFIFFEILDVASTFRKRLVKFVPLITSVSDVQKGRKTIEEHRKQKKPGLVKLFGVNIAFSRKGFVKVRRFFSVE